MSPSPGFGPSSSRMSSQMRSSSGRSATRILWLAFFQHSPESIERYFEPQLQGEVLDRREGQRALLEGRELHFSQLLHEPFEPQGGDVHRRRRLVESCDVCAQEVVDGQDHVPDPLGRHVWGVQQLLHRERTLALEYILAGQREPCGVLHREWLEQSPVESRRPCECALLRQLSGACRCDRFVHVLPVPCRLFAGRVSNRTHRLRSALSGVHARDGRVIHTPARCRRTPARCVPESAAFPPDVCLPVASEGTHVGATPTGMPGIASGRSLVYGPDPLRSDMPVETEMKAWRCVQYHDALAWVEAPTEDIDAQLPESRHFFG